MRTAPALLSAVAAAAVVLASLVGCAPSSTTASGDTSSCTPYYSSGAASSIVKVSGKKTAIATATFPTPLVAKGSQVSQNNVGTGPKVQDGDQVDYEYTVFSGKTGEALGSTSYGASGATPSRSGVSAVTWNTTSAKYQPSYSLARSLQCATVGERYTLVTTAKAGFGAGVLEQGNGIADSETLVFVITVSDKFLGKANGANVLPQDGMPNVITAVDGQPGLVIQELAKPTTLRIETVKAGTGATVKKGQTVHLKFTGWTWPATSSDKPEVWAGSSTQGDSTWTADQATDVTVKSGSLPMGLYKALLGAKVGSQVLAVIPPKDGFGSGSSTYGIGEKDTVIMVVDVLGIK